MVMGEEGTIELKTGVIAKLMFEGKEVGWLGVNNDKNRLLTLEAKGTEVTIQLRKTKE